MNKNLIKNPFILTIPIIISGTFIIYYTLDLQHRSNRTVEIFDFPENTYFISKDNRIITENGQLVTPGDQVDVLFNFKNKQKYQLLITPIVSILKDEKLIHYKILDPFIANSNQSRVKNYSFEIGPSGLNRDTFVFSIWNKTSNKDAKFIGNFTSNASYEVSPFADRLQNDSVFIAIGALLITSAIGIITAIFTYLGHKESLRDQSFDTTVKVFDLLSGKKNKERWKKLHDWYWELKDKGEKVILKDDTKRQDASQMKENLNKTGVLFYSGLIDRKLLMDIYGGIIIRLYKVLKDDIDDDLNTNPEASKYTIIMYQYACRYWKEKNHNSPDPEPFPKGNYPW